MAGVHITKDGDSLDLICLRTYGKQAGAVEAVLLANPHIKAFAHRLPRGQTIQLPDLSGQLKRSQPMRLYD